MKGILSGILIALGGYGYLVLGGIPGACIFAFGLISILYLEIPLYTGKAGVFSTERSQWKKSLGEVFLILLQNIVGCAIVALLFRFTANDDTLQRATNLILARLDLGIGTSILKAIGCGIIIDICVYLKKEKQTIMPVLFGVPLFILCGFIHSVADAFYLLCFPDVWTWQILLYYPAIVLGNFIGCNIRRICFITCK